MCALLSPNWSVGLNTRAPSWNGAAVGDNWWLHRGRHWTQTCRCFRQVYDTLGVPNYTSRQEIIICSHKYYLGSIWQPWNVVVLFYFEFWITTTSVGLEINLLLRVCVCASNKALLKVWNTLYTDCPCLWSWQKNSSNFFIWILAACFNIMPLYDKFDRVILWRDTQQQTCSK